jgi:serine/threonine protein kinase/DNA polymerase III delta prime subunit
MEQFTGRTIKGYELRDRIGSGSFGVVYRAYQPAVKREVAIKVILPERASSPNFVHRFEGEAQLVARMEHPYIVPLYDFWRDAEGAFLVMRLLPTSLRKALQKGQWNVNATARLLDQIAGALSVAHRAGVIHHDIKPDNILLDEDQNAYLTDFGIAKDLSAKEITQDGLIVGSPAYLTPEQIRGEAVMPASDIYSLGLVIFELLSGSKPYPDTTTPAELIYKHLNEPLPDLVSHRGSLPAALNMVLQTATAKAPDQRYATTIRFAEAFRAALPVVPREHPLPDRLTERELDILRLMVDGLSNKDIAAKLYLTLGTVRWYVQQIYTKLDAHSRPQAIKRAQQLKLVGSMTESQGTDMQKTALLQSKPTVSASVTSTALTTEQRNRQRMLEKVRTFWVKGILENSLHGVALIELGMREKPEAVERAWDLVLQQPDQPDEAIPHGTRIADVFDEMDGELLILGEPGSGKTTTLLELARDLLTEAEEDERQPLPVVFNLSSWAATRKPIHDWLIDELNSKYQIPRKIGQGWVDADMVLPLLDGLDEVKQEQRAACVEAINQWRQEHGFLPVAVCSRITDYEALSVRLRLRSAIVLQPLTVSQIDQSLAQSPADFAPLRTALRSDESLLALLKTPLMLSIVTLTYRDMPDKATFTSGTPEARNTQLFDTYIAQMLKRRGKNQPYTRQQTIHWLAWLAAKQREQGQTVFYIENMQPAVLLDSRLQRIAYSILVGIPFAMVYALITRNFGPFANPILIWFMIAMFVGLSFRRYDQQGSSEHEIAAKIRLPFTWRGLLAGIWRGLVVSVFTAMLTSVLTLPEAGRELYSYQSSNLYTSSGYRGLQALLILGILSIASFAIVYGLIDGLLSRRRHWRECDIRVADSIQWSWWALARLLMTGLIVGIFSGASAGLLLYLIEFLAQGHPPDSYSLVPGIFFGALAGMFIALMVGGAVSREVDIRTRPNQGIWRTARNAIRSGLIRGAIFGGIVAVIHLLTWQGMPFEPPDVNGAVTLLIVIALAVAFLFGGMAVIKHVIMRLILARSRDLPLNMARFLDYASDTILLRKVGGGYVFIHRMLLEHFAAMAPKSRKRKDSAT